ncbi:MAG: hypothetical protein OXT67_13785 [Zetaproteobacteria bacterium]|nr:hypothetical protein [Zetaproteobacteria bacterium]
MTYAHRTSPSLFSRLTVGALLSSLIFSSAAHSKEATNPASYYPPGASIPGQDGNQTNVSALMEFFSGLAYRSGEGPSTASGYLLGFKTSYKTTPWTRAGGGLYVYGQKSLKTASSSLDLSNVSGLHLHYGSRISSSIWLNGLMTVKNALAKVKQRSAAAEYVKSGMSTPMVGVGFTFDFNQTQNIHSGVGLMYEQLFLPAAHYSISQQINNSAETLQYYDGEKITVASLHFQIQWMF